VVADCATLGSWAFFTTEDRLLLLLRWGPGRAILPFERGNSFGKEASTFKRLVWLKEAFLFSSRGRRRGTTGFFPALHLPPLRHAERGTSSQPPSPSPRFFLSTTGRAQFPPPVLLWTLWSLSCSWSGHWSFRSFANSPAFGSAAPSLFAFPLVSLSSSI